MNIKSIGGIFVTLLIVAAIIGPLNAPKIYALLTFIVIMFVCNKVFTWRDKARKLDEQEEARKMEEWEKSINWKERNNRR
ncbi:hypothetical protein [Citrobacter freundii]|uniref:hypothetical protein n=1 Tax=Citrobacter freundii TaxID=546 RepID=UPI0029297987|nr:hypothetical protein [Citrobacter freundii]